MEPRRPSPLIIIAVIFAVGLIGFSAWFTMRGDPSPEELLEATHSELLRNIRPLQESDHVYGNPNAPIVFVVYTDFSCPYCKEYHNIITGLIEQYGKDGAVALVYRNIPFVQIHPESPMYAHAGECVADLADNTAYWNFVTLFFTRYLEQDKPNADDLIQFATEVGLSADAFSSCMRSNKFMDRIEEDYKEATGVGASASPFTVVIEPDMRRSFEGSRAYVELAGALLSSIQTFEAKRILPLKDATPEMPAVDIPDVPPTTATDTPATSTEETTPLP